MNKKENFLPFFLFYDTFPLVPGCTFPITEKKFLILFSVK